LLWNTDKRIAAVLSFILRHDLDRYDVKVTIVEAKWRRLGISVAWSITSWACWHPWHLPREFLTLYFFFL